MFNLFPSSTSILIIDDDPSNIRILGQSLQDKGDIFFALTGEEGIRLANKIHPHIIFLDLEMPGQNGYEVCRQLKANPVTAESSVIFVTAHSGSQYEVAALETGAVDFICKPLNATVIRARTQTHLTLIQQTIALHELAISDTLTGIFNRGYFDNQLKSEWRRHQRQAQPLGIALIDVDFFKAYNDTYGHVQGDQCLKNIAQTIHTATQHAGEVVSRYGGEEFGVILPGADPNSCEKYGEWICEKVRALNIPHLKSSAAATVTISVGLASIVPGSRTSLTEALQAADRALYTAKSTGRNKWVVEALPNEAPTS